MPAVSFYLNQQALDAVRARAKAQNIPVSRIIREAIEQYLDIAEKKAARERLLKIFVEENPLGGIEAWGDLHRERTEADADRR